MEARSKEVRREEEDKDDEEEETHARVLLRNLQIHARVQVLAQGICWPICMSTVNIVNRSDMAWDRRG